MKIKDFRELFNNNVRDTVWDLYKKDMLVNFRGMLRLLHTMYLYPDDFCKNHVDGFERLMCGYRGTGFNNGIPTGFMTRDASLPYNSTTNDHIIGAKECGRIVREEFKKCNFDFDYMCNVWLYDNLYLWGTIKVTKEQHERHNIKRDEHTLEEKINFEHYEDTPEIIYKKYNFRPRRKKVNL